MLFVENLCREKYVFYVLIMALGRKRSVKSLRSSIEFYLQTSSDSFRQTSQLAVVSCAIFFPEIFSNFNSKEMLGRISWRFLNFPEKHRLETSVTTIGRHSNPMDYRDIGEGIP